MVISNYVTMGLVTLLFVSMIIQIHKLFESCILYDNKEMIDFFGCEGVSDNMHPINCGDLENNSFFDKTTPTVNTRFIGTPCSGKDIPDFLFYDISFIYIDRLGTVHKKTERTLKAKGFKVYVINQSELDMIDNLDFENEKCALFIIPNADDNQLDELVKKDIQNKLKGDYK
mgnify:FL=1